MRRISIPGLGEGYSESDEILAEKITGEFKYTIVPRAAKPKEEQIFRTKNKGEVFTPAWICNLQNNLGDNEWFGREGIFNIEDNENKTWTTNNSPIKFPEGKTWKDYITLKKLEVACGEAPYVVSRYDNGTGEWIEPKNRIGFLDRKIRVVSENCKEETTWKNNVVISLMNSYALDYQGDNVLLARENFLSDIKEWHECIWNKTPDEKFMMQCAVVISWNVFQCDFFTGIFPNFSKNPEKKCKKSKKALYYECDGESCLLMDWKTRTPVTLQSLCE